MVAKSYFSKSKWADGKYSVEISPYMYSKKGFNSLLHILSQHLSFDLPEADVIGSPGIPEHDNYWVEFKIDNEEVIAAMDEYTCSIACESEQLRDKIYDMLLKAS